MGKTIKLIKNRSDIGAGTRGSDLGIDAIEIAAINQNSDYFNRFMFEDVKTHNETIYDKDRSSSAKRIEHVLEQCIRVNNVVKQSIVENYFPIVLSGDHSSALGTLSGIKAAYPEQNIGVFWIDAHADLHSPYTSPSGNIHGMPLSAALGDDNLSCQNNEVTPETHQDWEEMKNIGHQGPKVLPENLIYFGVRDTEEEEDKQIEKLKIKNYKVDEVRYRGLQTCVTEALAKVAHCEVLYISFDVDSMDCDMISYGTGTPVAKGFDQYEIIAIINQIIQTKKVVCVEFVEVNPLLDTKGNKMAETAFEVLEAITPNLMSVNL
ncbi:Arginase [Flavobacterium sp. CECT 9288]|uniref:arginase n=1 Tax=Flavobacterium sp. CECT 9288 TaxID=2845819 RepID=UPI001E5B9896|nr:arginase [Flavobacterium sp. CECT 9288]CAH0336204.1 Arginase [Flavobacterium sp. CECT 9288]